MEYAFESFKLDKSNSPYFKNVGLIGGKFDKSGFGKMPEGKSENLMF